MTDIINESKLTQKQIKEMICELSDKMLFVGADKSTIINCFIAHAITHSMFGIVNGGSNERIKKEFDDFIFRIIKYSIELLDDLNKEFLHEKEIEEFADIIIQEIIKREKKNG